MLQKKYPPYSKPLVELIKKNLRPTNDIYLFIGNQAWKKGESFSFCQPTRTLILPPWQSASDFYWPVIECDILIFDTGYAEKDYIYEIAQCLYDGNASNVRMVSPEFDLILYHKE